MPTHRDHPWERDLAVVLGRPAHRRSRRTPVLLVLILAGAVAAAVLLRPDGAGVAGPASVARSGPASGAPAPGAVKRLRSRYLDRATLEVWGRTTAPDGATVRLRLRGGRRAGVRRAAPVVDGRFYTKVHLPRALRGGAVRVYAVVGD